jgi:peptidoglycan/LPS O-acetylase OafA/YrhL
MDESRRPSIDLLRLVAAFGIVWAHMGAPGMIEGYAALAAFLILTAFLSLRSWRRSGGRRFWMGRALRFLLPWVVWSAAFLLLESLRQGGLDVALSGLGPLDWLIGPTIHLWFLPFVLLASPLVPLASATLTTARRVWWAAALLVPPGAGAILLHDRFPLPEPLVQWAFATTPFLYGLLSAAAWERGTVGPPVAFATAVMGIAVAGWGSQMAPFVLGAALLFEATWRLPLRRSSAARVAAGLAAVSFGIYLVHPAAMLVWWKLAPGLPVALGAVAVFLGSAALAWALRRLPYGRLIA